MAKGKNVPIIYTNRDFDSIKEELVNYAKRYYPNSYNDFTEASFGSMMFDMVAYVGDMLSYYVDYQANESFLDTAVEFTVRMVLMASDASSLKSRLPPKSPRPSPISFSRCSKE